MIQCFLGYRCKQSAYEQQWNRVSLVTTENKALMNSNDSVSLVTAVNKALMNSNDSVSLVTAVNKAVMNRNDTVLPWLPL